MIGVVGVGGCGGNIADEAANYNCAVAAINFSEKDLESLENIKAKLRLTGSDGVGRNRELAKSLFIDSHEVAINFVKEQFGSSAIDVVVVAFSTSGGSGSGIAPMLIDICHSVMPEKTFVAMPIIPDTTEADISQINCVKAFEELSRLDVAIFPIDNNKMRNKTPSVGKNRLYEAVNASAMGLLFKAYHYTEKHSKDGNFDKKDFINVLRTKGIGLISEVDFDTTAKGTINISKEGIAQAVQKSWDDSIFAPIEYEQVVKASVIFDGDENHMKFLDYQAIFSKFESGMPIYLYDGNYHESTGKIMTVLTGLSWCVTRLSEIENLISNSQQKINSILSTTANQFYESKAAIDMLSQLQQPSNQPPQKISELVKKWKR